MLDAYLTEVSDLQTLNIEPQRKNIVVAIASSAMGDLEFGKQLMQEFIEDLPRQEHLPKTIIFYNSGVEFVSEGTSVKAALEFLQAQDVQILVCQKSLAHLNLDLIIGKAVTINTLSDCLLSADLIVRP